MLSIVRDGTHVNTLGRRRPASHVQGAGAEKWGPDLERNKRLSLAGGADSHALESLFEVERYMPIRLRLLPVVSETSHPRLEII